MYTVYGDSIILFLFVTFSCIWQTEGICLSNRDVTCTSTIQQSMCTIINTTGIVQETLRNCSTGSQLHITVKSGVEATIDLDPLVTHLLQLVLIAEEESTVALHINSVPENLILLSLGGDGRIKLFQRKEKNFFQYFENVEIMLLYAKFDFTFIPSFTSLRSLRTLLIVGVKGDTSSTGFKQVTCLDGSIIGGLESLILFSWLDGNLEKIASDAFRGVSKLNTLNLRDNRIQSIEARALDSLTQIVSIDLTGNIIQNVTPPVFHASTGLLTLRLSNNPFFPLEALNGTYATDIFLDNNGYETLRAVSFQGLVNRPVTISLTELLVCNCSLKWTAEIAEFGVAFTNAICKWPASSLGREIQVASYDGCNKTLECFGLNSTCSEGAPCVTDATGSYCGCPLGYSYNSQASRCEDIDECENNVTITACEHACNNTIGSFYCSCGIGYQVAGNGRDCEDTNECLLDNAGCEYACINTEGGYFCVCESGLTTTEAGECTQLRTISTPMFIWGLVVSLILFVLIIIFSVVTTAYAVYLCTKRYRNRNSIKKPVNQPSPIRCNSVSYENVDPDFQPYAVVVNEQTTDMQDNVSGEERKYYVI